MNAQNVKYPVVFQNDTLAFFAEPYEHLRASDRADILEKHLLEICLDSAFIKDSIKVVSLNGEVELYYLGSYLTTFIQADTAANDAKLLSLALHVKHSLYHIQNNEEISANLQKTLMQTLMIFLVVLVSILIFYLVKRIYRMLVKRLETGDLDFLKTIHFKQLELMSKDRQLQVLLVLLKAARILVTGILIYLTVPIVFSFFPETADVANRLFGYVLQPLASLMGSVLRFIPELISIAVIIMVSYYLLRFLKFLMFEIHAERIKVNGFFPEWALPTYKILRVAVIALTFLLIFPHIPGSDSTLVIGFFAFIGIVLALGSTQAVGNFISGMVITYMRPFKVGERVKVGETSGEVVDKNLLITRIKTKYNEIVTIPNSELLKDHTINYSVSENELGLIIYTSIKISTEYNWQIVETYLLEAAKGVEGVLQNPKPFVLKRRIENGMVEYQLNVYSEASDRLARVKSALNQNMLTILAENQISIK